MQQINSTQEIKSINTQIKQLESNLNALNEDVKTKQKAASAMSNRVAALKEKLLHIQTHTSRPIISEHALLRYLERVKGVDMEELKNEILDNNTVSQIKFAGSCSIKKENYTLVVKNNTILTIKN